MEETEEQKKMAKKREYILKEIISTEITYVDRLRFAVEVIIQPLKENSMLDSNDLLAQFSILEKIFQLHMKYSVTELETYPEKFGAFFQNICDNVQTYTDYLLNYESSMQRRCSLLISNRRFSDFLDKAEKDPRMQGQKSESIFILPVQRIPRYRLLLESLLKCTPEEHAQYSVVKNALDKICDMAMYSNEAIRARENKAKIMDIIKTIEPRTRVDLLADPDRVFIKEGPLLRQCRRGLKEFHFWLFNDQLLYGQATPLGLFILNRQIPLNKCYVNPCESMHDGGYCFIVESPAKSFILCLPTEAEKTEWLDAINNAILALAKARQSKAKQSRQSFAPLWTPDKNSTSCQKCRNAFSLISRRHHCRNCGAIVCDNCSKKRIKLEHVDQHRQVRVCDACFLYLSSPEATKSIRMNSVRLQKRLSSAGGTETNASTDAVEGDELYFSDPDEEDYEEREQLDEDDLNDFNDTMNDEHNQEEFHNMVLSGKSGSTSTYLDRDSDVTLPPTLLQQVGKGLSGVISFANPVSRLRNTQEDNHTNGGLATPSSSEGSPKPPPKPARPSSPTTPSMQHSPGPATPTTPVAATAAPPRRGILKSVSAFVTSGSTFLSNAASAAGGGGGGGGAGAADTSHLSPGPSPARPIIMHAASEKITIEHDATPAGGRPKAASFASSGTTSNSSAGDQASMAASAAAAVDSEQRLSISATSTDGTSTTRKSEDTGERTSIGAGAAASTVDAQQISAAPEPPVKPPKPPRMARRTNICIKPGDLATASASQDGEES